MTTPEDTSSMANSNRHGSSGETVRKKPPCWLRTGACLLAAAATMPSQASILLAEYNSRDYVLVDSSPTRTLYIQSKGWIDIAAHRSGSVLLLYSAAQIDPLRRTFWSRSYSVTVSCRSGVVSASSVWQGHLDGMYDGMQLNEATDISEINDPRLRDAVCGNGNVDGYIASPEPATKFGTLKGLTPGMEAAQIPSSLLRSCTTVPRGRRTGQGEYVADYSDCTAIAPFHGSASAFGSLGGVAIKSVRIALCDRKLVNVAFYTAPYPVATKASPGPKHQLLRPLIEGGYAPTRLTFDYGHTHPKLVSASWQFSDWSFNLWNGGEESTAAFQVNPFERDTATTDLLAGRAARQNPWSCTREIKATNDFK